ncbi:MAG: hypothetical protein IT302_06365 [Dehalococcoidia bacterium]|nr:hypothetical protein [Dehalococcoidia bacterium]
MRRFLLGMLGCAAVLAAACGDEGPRPPAASSLTAAADPSAAVATKEGARPGATTTNAPAKRLGTSSGVAHTAKEVALTAIAGATLRSGTLDGARYVIEVPERWNGELVLWAHGFAGFDTVVVVDPPPSVLRRTWIEQGYAWAASSYKENGYVPGIGADDTLALKGQFAKEVGAPKRTYIVGASMGGNVVALSLEHFPEAYDGGLAVCGALGGEEQVDYLLSWTLLGEAIAGVQVPIGTNVPLLPALLSLSGKLGTATAPTDIGLQYLSAIRMLSGGPRPFFLEGFALQATANFGYALADPGRTSLPFQAATNEGVRYGIDPATGLTAEALNAKVRRLAPVPGARDAAAHPDAVPTSGRIGDPLLTLHNTGDLFVPISMEQSYLAKAKAAGTAGFLVQRAIRAAGHCQFSDAERLAAWNDLVAWVRDGKKPAGEDLSGDLSNAGMAFTNPLRAGDPGTR